MNKVLHGSRRSMISVATMFSLVAMMLAAPSHAVAAPTPTLDINRISFCTSDNDWEVTVTTAEPYSVVTLYEYRWVSGSWVTAWIGNIGTTDGNGELVFEARAPDTVGHYYAQVLVEGEWSNSVVYWASSC
jgi:hypothetical protein